MEPKILERDVLRDVKQFLDLHKLFYFRANNGGTFNRKTGGYFFHGTPGVPDLILLHNKITVGIELKAPGKKMSNDQREFHDNMMEYGGWLSCCVSSVDELKKDLRDAGIL